jgi:ribosomal protein RSM22 (predicted rRNA methylase)
MSDPIKLTEKEINTFTETTQIISNVTSELGTVELTLAEFEAELEKTKTKKQQLIDSYKDAIRRQRDHQQLLFQKYGKGTLNTDTWEFEPSEDDE